MYGGSRLTTELGGVNAQRFERWVHMLDIFLDTCHGNHGHVTFLLFGDVGCFGDRDAAAVHVVEVGVSSAASASAHEVAID